MSFSFSRLFRCVRSFLSLSLSLSFSLRRLGRQHCIRQRAREVLLSLSRSLNRSGTSSLSVPLGFSLSPSVYLAFAPLFRRSFSLTHTHIHTHTQTIVLSWRQYGLRRLLLNLLDSVANVFLGSTLPHHAAQRCAAPLGTARHAISLFPRSLSCFDLAWKSNEQKPPQQPERSLRCSCHAGFASQLQVICHRHHPRAPCLCQYLLL